MIDVIPYDEVAGEVVSDGAECVGVLADHVLAEQGVDAADYPDGADEDLVQHGELVAVLTALLTLRPAVHKTCSNTVLMRTLSSMVSLYCIAVITTPLTLCPTVHNKTGSNTVLMGTLYSMVSL